MIEYTEGLPLKYAENWETHIFHLHFLDVDLLDVDFLDVDILLTMKLTRMKKAICIAEMCWEGSVT